MPTGRVRYYDAEKGFGFLSKDEGGDDVYVRSSALPDGVTSLKRGQKVEFGVVDGKRGEQALSVHLIEAPPSLSKAARKSPDAMAVIVEDLIKMLDGIGNSYRRGRHPDPKVAGKVAAVLRAVADELGSEVPVAPVIDQACAEAVDVARAAADVRAGLMGVGDHCGVIVEDTRVVTHLFECPHPGYPGWLWQVTVSRAARARTVTVNEVTLLPGETSLLAPRWVPWAERVGAGDLTPGVLMPTPDNDPRVEPGFNALDAGDADPAEWAATRAVVAELGLGRERVLSPLGRDEAADRWLEGPGGPDNPMTQQAPGTCETCAYFIALTSPLGRVFGVCANEHTPDDGRVVSRDHGCGAHSDVTDVSRAEQLPPPIWDTVTVDPALF